MQPNLVLTSTIVVQTSFINFVKTGVHQTPVNCETSQTSTAQSSLDSSQRSMTQSVPTSRQQKVLFENASAVGTIRAYSSPYDHNDEYEPELAKPSEFRRSSRSYSDDESLNVFIENIESTTVSYEELDEIDELMFGEPWKGKNESMADK